MGVWPGELLCDDFVCQKVAQTHRASVPGPTQLEETTTKKSTVAIVHCS